MDLLVIERLAKVLPNKRRLFSDLALTVERGEFIAITGESGVGKSSLLNLIAGLDTIDQGSITLDGIALESLTEAAAAAVRRERIGFVFQAFHLLPHLTLAQNVGLPLVLLRRPAADARREALALLERVGLKDRGNDYPAELSGGELQRVAIARAVVHRPDLILADEPTGNLDPETASRILALFVAQAREAGAGVLLVTHSEAAAAAADRVLRLTTAGLVPA